MVTCLVSDWPLTLRSRGVDVVCARGNDGIHIISHECKCVQRVEARFRAMNV
jgi:hypothetical protein